MAGIMYEDVRLPDGFEGKLAFVLHNVFTHKECSEYIEKTEEMGYTKAMLNVGYGRLRFLRYDPGEFFLPHMDGSYMRENGERSYITVQLYLNEGFQAPHFLDIQTRTELKLFLKLVLFLYFNMTFTMKAHC